MKSTKSDTESAPTLDYPAKRPSSNSYLKHEVYTLRSLGASDAEIRELTALIRRVAFSFMHRNLCGCQFCVEEFCADMPILVPLVLSFIGSIRGRAAYTVPCRQWLKHRRATRTDTPPY